MAEPEQKKYDTINLMEGFKKSANRAKWIGIGVAALILAGIAYLLFGYEPEHHDKSTSELFAAKGPTAATETAPASAPAPPKVEPTPAAAPTPTPEPAPEPKGKKKPKPAKGKKKR